MPAKHPSFPFKSLFVLVISFYSCNNQEALKQNETDDNTPVINYTVLQTYKHDTSNFTEGLFASNGKLLESTGSPEQLPKSKSIICELDLVTGETRKRTELDRSKYFGEGIASLNGNIYYLTYKNQVAFVYDAETFQPKDSFKYENIEGWGLTTDSSHLIMSDGTDQLTFIDSKTYNTVKKIPITWQGKPLSELNELEYINGFIYANIYNTNRIVKIDPNDGSVVGVLDLSTLVNEAKVLHPNALELNGIAFEPTRKSLFITGKCWPKIYEISISL